jgi:hypothetical protein
VSWLAASGEFKKESDLQAFLREPNGEHAPAAEGKRTRKKK